MQNPFIIPADIQQLADEIMARSQARFGHDLFRMEEDTDGGGGGGDDAAAAAAAAAKAEEDAAAAALGDAGKQALDRMKAERDQAKKDAKANAAELEKLRNASKSEQEKAIDAARKEGESEATKRANARVVRTEAKVLAISAKFRDPSDVVTQLGSKLSEITVDDDGEVDAKALKALVDGLAKSKPYLLDDGKPRPVTAAEAGIGVTGDRTKTDTGTGRSRMRAAIEAGTKK